MPDLSKGELRRLVIGGGVRVNEEKIDLEAPKELKKGDVLKIGKRNWFKIG